MIVSVAVEIFLLPARPREPKELRPARLSCLHQAHDAPDARRDATRPVQAQGADPEPIRTLDRDAVPPADGLAAPGALPHRRIDPEIERELLGNSIG